MTWAPNTRLGPYTLLAPIGAGGMGEVWKARDTRLNRSVAIKRLKAAHTARFEQEARAIAALNHPHICQIYDLGPDYFVMEYIEGTPLKGPLSPEESVRLALQILSALDEAHQKNILHRDLKPANILITPRGDAKLLDFGLAKEISNADSTQTLEGVVMGTIPYMSPEQAEGRTLDPRSEVFSFGTVLYEALSGTRAFSSLGAVLRDQPRRIEAPEPLRNIIERCMQKNPSQRFQTVAELKAALEKLALKPVSRLQPSIAVLPFANMSRDADDEYFSDGLAEEIINALAKIPDLKVIARTSAFAFKGQNTDIRRIAETLGVSNILEGSVRRAGSRLRIAAQLISSADGSHLWSERYDREMADIFAVQDEISAAIAAALHVKLSPTILPKRRYQPKLPAYEACLRARHMMSKATPDAFVSARQGFEQAIALDPGFALAHIHSASTFIANAVLGLQPAHEAMPQARKLALRALELDPDVPEAHAILGTIAAQYDYDWPEAERRFQRAMSYTPVSSDVHRAYGFYLLYSGRPAEGVEELFQSVLEDPLFPITRLNYSMALAAANRLPEAIEEMRKLQELDAAFWPAHVMLSNLYWLQGDLAQALVYGEKAYGLAPWSYMTCTALAGTLAAAGQTERAAELISKLRPDAYGVPMALAAYHVLAGEFDVAAEWYAKGIEQRDPRALPSRYMCGPEFHSSAYWPRLAKMMNLPLTMTSRSF